MQSYIAPFKLLRLPAAGRRVAGQGMVEFALMAPIVLLMFYGLVEVGRYMQAYLTAQHAAREGARYAVTGQSTTGDPADRPASIVYHTHFAAAGLRIDHSGIDQAYSNTDCAATTPNCLDVYVSPSQANLSTAELNPVTVTVRYNFEPLLPMSLVTPGGRITLLPSILQVQGQATMINERISRVTPVPEGSGQLPGYVGGGGPTTYAISGAVSGDATSGVTMTLSGDSTGTTTTDGSGNYSFTGLSNGSYTVTPSKAGCTFSPTSRNVTLTGANSTGNDFTATCTTPHAISGTVSGDVVSGVTITLTGDSSGSTTTDASGNYSFSGLGDGNYTVTPSYSGCTFSPTSRNVTLSGADSTGNDFTASCASTYTISGTILDGDSNPISGVTVDFGAAGTTTTDANGYYQKINLADSTTYTLTPSKTNCSFSPTSRNVTLSGANSTGNDFTATCTYTISGTVTDGGNAVSGVTITLSGAGSGSTTTDASGNYSFSGLSNGNYTLTPSKTSCSFNPDPANVTVSAADVTQDFTATCTYTISGTITESGSPLSGVTVTLSGDSSGTATTDASGNYSFSVGVGSYTVTPSLTGYTFSPTSANITITNASQTQDFTATAAGTCLIALNNTPDVGVSDSKKITFQIINNAASSVTIDKVTVTWDLSGPKIKEVKMPGKVWKEDGSAGNGPSGKQSSGAVLDIDDVTISSGGTVNVELKFDSNITGASGTVTLTTTTGATCYISFGGGGGGGGGSCQVALNNTPDVGVSDSKKITFQIINNDGSSVTIDKVTPTWDVSGAKIKEAKMPGKVWKEDGSAGNGPSGKQTSGTQLDIDDVTINSGGTADVELKFDKNISGASGTVTFETTTGDTCSISYP